MSRRDDIYVGGYQGDEQLDPADSLAGEIGQDPLDAGYSPPDREPRSAHPDTTFYDERHHALAERLAAEEPDVCEADLDRAGEQPRAGRLVAPAEPILGGDEEFAEDAGRAGWASSAEEAAMHIVER